jgi:hypothetical protein
LQFREKGLARSGTEREFAAVVDHVDTGRRDPIGQYDAYFESSSSRKILLVDFYQADGEHLLECRLEARKGAEDSALRPLSIYACRTSNLKTTLESHQCLKTCENATQAVWKQVLQQDGPIKEWSRSIIEL